PWAINVASSSHQRLINFLSGAIAAVRGNMYRFESRFIPKKWKDFYGQIVTAQDPAGCSPRWSANRRRRSSRRPNTCISSHLLFELPDVRLCLFLRWHELLALEPWQ